MPAPRRRGADLSDSAAGPHSVKTSKHGPRWTRRRFLRRGTHGALALTGAALVTRLPGVAQQVGANPYAYDLKRFRRVDPNLIGYELSTRFRCGCPDPRRLVIDAKGRLYVAAGGGVTILDPQGNPLSAIECDAPARAMGLGEDETRYLALRDHVEVWDAKNRRLATWERPPGRPFLTGVAVGSNAVFVADSGNRVILRYDRAGKLAGRIGERNREKQLAGFIVPSPYLDVKLAPDGLLRVNNPGRHRVEAYTVDGDLEGSWGKPSAAIEGFCGCCNPVGLALLPDGRCVTFEKGLPRAKVYDETGRLLTVVAGPQDFDDVSTQPSIVDADESAYGGLDGAVDAAGLVYVLELLTGWIRVYRPKPAPTPGSARS